MTLLFVRFTAMNARDSALSYARQRAGRGLRNPATLFSMRLWDGILANRWLPRAA